MTDRSDPDFERRLESHLSRQLDVAVRKFDPDAIALTASAPRRHPLGRALIGMATALVAGALTLAAIQLFIPSGPLSGGPGPSSSAQLWSEPVSTPTATASCSNVPAASISPSGSSVVDSTGILLVALGEQVQAVPACEEMAMAFDGILRLAQANTSDFGYPWIDPTTNELIFSVATAEGRALAEEAGTSLVFPYRIRDVTHSYAVLEQIQTDVTYLRDEGVVDAELIHIVIPDQRDNRTLIVISEMSRPLLEELARRFGADAIGIQVDPNRL